MAIRAAWEHAATPPVEVEEEAEELVSLGFIASQGVAANQPAYAAA